MATIQQSLSDIQILYDRKQNIDLLLQLINPEKIKVNNIPKFVFKGPLPTDIYDNNQTKIFGSVIEDNVNLYFNKNAIFNKILGNSKILIGSYKRYHEAIIKNETMLVDGNNLLSFLKNSSYNKNVFIHEFKDGFYPLGNTSNKFMVYVVPPKGTEYSIPGLFLKAVHEVSYNMMELIDKHDFSKKMETLRICLFSAGLYTPTNVRYVEVAASIIKGILQYINMYGTSVKTIEFAHAGGNFENAWNILNPQIQ